MHHHNKRNIRKMVNKKQPLTWSLESMDAAPEELHLRPMRRRVRDTATYQSVLHLTFFFITHVDSRRCGTDSHQLRPYRSISGKTPKPTETADLGQNSKKIKKKRCKTHRLNLITNPNGLISLTHSSVFNLHFKLQFSLSLVSLCFLPLCLCSPSPL